jgi:hypothetical protein
MKRLIVTALIAVALTACSTTQLQEAETVGESIAWTTANAYETANTAAGGALTSSLLNAALVSTHNTPDEAVVDALGKQADGALKSVASAQVAAIQAKLATAASNAGSAAAASGATGTGIQAAQTAVLSDPGVIAKAAAAAPSLTIPVGTTPVVLPFTSTPVDGAALPASTTTAAK